MEKEKIEKMVDEVMDGFDFVKVHNVIKFLDWKWDLGGWMDVPSIYLLAATARSLLTTAAAHLGEEYFCVGTGGFTASVECETELMLRFHVAEWGCSTDD